MMSGWPLASAGHSMVAAFVVVVGACGAQGARDRERRVCRQHDGLGEKGFVVVDGRPTRRVGWGAPLAPDRRVVVQRIDHARTHRWIFDPKATVGTDPGRLISELKLNDLVSRVVGSRHW